MEKMPYRPEMDTQLQTITAPVAEIISTDWRSGLPVLSGQRATLRELRMSDAASLCAMLTSAEVARFISPPPTTVEGFERFIAWTLRQRAAGTYVCFAVTLHGFDTAIGIFQVRETEPGFGTAEWGFAIGSPFWGTGVFEEGANLVLEFVFDTMGVHPANMHTAVETYEHLGDVGTYSLNLHDRYAEHGPRHACGPEPGRESTDHCRHDQ